MHTYTQVVSLYLLSKLTAPVDIHSSRIRILRFLKIQKTRLFTFFKRHFKKRKKRNPKSKFQTLLTFHYMESPLQLKNNACL